MNPPPRPTHFAEFADHTGDVMHPASDELPAVLAAWPADCQPRACEALGAAGGFSGARFWRLDAPRGRLCLRRWPPSHPTPERLKYIHAVLGHVHRGGFKLVPVPLETLHGAGFVETGGHLWELTPWLPGVADYRIAPSDARLEAAMTALAEFHGAAASLPSSIRDRLPSPGMEERLRRLESLLGGGFDRLRAAVASVARSEGFSPGEQEFDLNRMDGAASTADTAVAPGLLHRRASVICRLFPLHAAAVLERLARASKLRVRWQPCIRDIWHDHVLFEGERVGGLVDFGGMRAENVSADVARLLGSLAADDRPARQRGLAAYEAARPLSADERVLLEAFDRSGVLLSGINWLSWLYLDGRSFDNAAGVLARLDENVARLERLDER